MMAFEIRYHFRLSLLIRVFLAKPIPNRYLKIREFVKAPIAKNNVHGGAAANAESIDQPWRANLPAMLTGASIAHTGTIANGLFEASTALWYKGALTWVCPPFPSRRSGWRKLARSFFIAWEFFHARLRSIVRWAQVLIVLKRGVLGQLGAPRDLLTPSSKIRRMWASVAGDAAQPCVRARGVFTEFDVNQL
jgi:hypothetical protein